MSELPDELARPGSRPIAAPARAAHHPRPVRGRGRCRRPATGWGVVRRAKLLTAVAAVIAATAAVAVGVAAADGTTATTASAAAKPKWLTISGFWDGTTAPQVVGSASGRGWIGLPRFSQRGMGLTLGSLRRVGGRLSFAQAVLAAHRPMFIVGSQLFYHLPDVSGFPGELRAAALLATGKVGKPRAIPDDPEKIPPQELHPTVETALPVGDRLVWLLGGAKMNENGNLERTYLWACCSTTGELRDLTRFIKQGRRNFFAQLALDSKNRLWLAWLEFFRTSGAGSVRIVELDPATLAPRTPKTLAFPGGDRSTAFALTCAATCRLVVSEFPSGNLVSWSPGQRSPTKLASGTRESPANLLDASDRSSHLTAAYIASRSRDPAKAQVHEIEVVSGDARGSHPRHVGAVDLPDAIGPSADLYHTAYATFAPGGLVYFAFYYPGGPKTRVLAGLLRLGR